MADKKHLFREYFKCFFFQRYDCQKNDLSEDMLRKLQPKLSDSEKALIHEVKTVTKQVYDLLSEDKERDGTPEDEVVLNSYERLADRGEIPVDARCEMYNLILYTRDKYIPGHQDYLQILQKKINLLQKKDLSDLTLSYMQIHEHSYGIDRNFTHFLIKEVYKKNPKNSIFPPEEAAALAKEVLKDKRNARYKSHQDLLADINTQLAGSVPPFERAELLEKKYGIIGKTGIGRLNAAKQKMNIAEELQILFKSMNNYKKEEYYSREAETQNAQIILINRHINKGKRR